MAAFTIHCLSGSLCYGTVSLKLSFIEEPLNNLLYLEEPLHMKSLQAKIFDSAEPVCRYRRGRFVKIKKVTDTIQTYNLK
jgi:hypothetical protein